MTPEQPVRTGPATGAEQPILADRSAGIVSRGLAAAIDVLVVLSVSVIGYLALVLFRLIVNPRTFGWPGFNLFFSLTAFAVVSIVYLSIGWGTSGRTVGTALLGLRVVTTRGRLRWPIVILRAAFCTVFPIGLLWVVVDARRRSVPDIALRTRVVYANRTTAADQPPRT